MIHVERKNTPPGLNSPPVQRARKEAEVFFSVPHEDRKQKSFKFFPITRLPNFRESLDETFSGKCAFCESRITETDYTDMDRFRPTYKAIGLDGEPSPQHYWWLAYEWTNIYMACFVCNKLKGSRFPVGGARAEERTYGEKLLDEQPLLLDPCADYPEEELLFDEMGMVASDTKRGRMTIEVFGLNRRPLVEARKVMLEALRELWDAAFARGSKLKPGSPEFYEGLDDPKQPYRAMRRQFLQSWSLDLVAGKQKLRRPLQPFLSFRTALAARSPESATKSGKAVVRETFERFKKYQDSHEKYSIEKGTYKENYYLRTRYIERVEIKNFKAIDALDLPFPVGEMEHGTWMLLLGENGMGKSSVLHALALALIGDVERRSLLSRIGLVASDFVRFGTQKGYVKVYLTGAQEPIELHFEEGQKQFKSNPKEPKVLLLGYGATRLLPNDRDGRKAPLPAASAAKADNLFDPFVPLNDAEAWLCTLPKDGFDAIASGLKKLLLIEDDKQELVRDCAGGKHKIFVRAHRTRTPISYLSAGYQSVVALTADIMSVMRLRWESMENAEGIVLLDEIDAHLHPRWRMQIVSLLRQAFPRLQFVVSSHDPLCLRGLHAGEVTVMKRDTNDRRGTPIAITDLPSPDSLRVDQLLTSEYFGLSSTIDPEVEKLFERYYELLALRKPTARQNAELERLKTQLDSRQQFGDTRRERLVLEVADSFLAKSDLMADKIARQQLEEETKKRIAELWDTVSSVGGDKA
jgi:5-methylcytosine-specific restriction endonuclease McrA